MSRIAILGLGAIGSVMVKYLSEEPRHDLFFFNRSQKDTIRIQCAQDEHILSIQLSKPEELAQDLDYLIICLKAYHYPTAKEIIEQLITRTKCTVIFRNGIDISLGLPIQSHALIETIIDCPTQMISANNYNQLREAKITLEDNPRMHAFAKLFLHTKVEFNFVEDFRTEQWKKLIESAALGGILCHARQDCSIFEKEEYLSMYEGLLKECIRVARADGAALPNNFYQEILSKRAAYPKSKGSSMLTDLLNGRRLELQAKNKAIKILAKKYDILTPVNNRICVELEAYNSTLD